MTRGFTEQYQQLLQEIKIVDYGAVPRELKETVEKNSEVIIWLAKIGRATAPGYLISICHFLKCVNVSDPAKLLDLKGYESIKRRFFPAEKLVETWQAKARKEGLADALIKKKIRCGSQLLQTQQDPAGPGYMHIQATPEEAVNR